MAYRREKRQASTAEKRSEISKNIGENGISSRQSA